MIYKFMLEYGHGILWQCDDDLTPYFEEEFDQEINILNDKSEDLYLLCFEENSHNQPLYFNKETFNSIKQKLIEIKSLIYKKLLSVGVLPVNIIDKADELK